MTRMIQVSEDALNSIKAMAQRLQDERDELLVASGKAVNQCIRLGSQYGTDGYSHNEALANLQEIIAKFTKEPEVMATNER